MTKPLVALALGLAASSCGGGTVTLYTSPSISSHWSIAVDSANVYWTDFRNGTVMKIPSNGGTASTLAESQGFAQEILADSNDVYWSSFTDAGTVMKLSSAGGGSPTMLASTGPGQPWAMTLDATNVYWTGSCSTDGGCAVMKVAISGSGPPSSIAVTPGAPNFGVAVDATDIYWSELDGLGDVLVRAAPLGGGTPMTLASETMPVLGVAADGTNVYWLTHDVALESYAVKKVPAGGGAAVTLASGSSWPGLAIAVGGGSVYWTTEPVADVTYAVMSVAATGSAPITLATGEGTPDGIALDASSIYWVAYGVSADGGETNSILKCPAR